MRFLVTAVVLSGLQFGMGQAPGGTRADKTPAVQNPQPVPQVPAPQTQIRRAAATGTTPAAGGAMTQAVPLDTPIVTFTGLCSASRAKGSPCKTVITREDLDRFVKAFSPSASGPVQGRLAIQYAKILAYSMLAEQQGFDKNPELVSEIEAQLKMIRMRILASAFAQALQTDVPASTDADIQKYYEAHRDMYQQAQVLRISVPLEAPNDTGKPLERSQVMAAMEGLRKRAVNGEELNQLQQEAYKQFHIQAAAPPITTTTLQRRNLQGSEEKAFDLKPGEVTPVLDLPAAVAIIKLESKGALPVESVRPEMEAWLRGTRAEAELGKFTSKIKTDFNIQYLALPFQPDLFGAGGETPSAARSTLLPATKRKQ